VSAKGSVSALSRLPLRQRTIGDVDRHRHAGHIGCFAGGFERLGRVFPNDAGAVSELYPDREIAILRNRLGAAFRVGVREMCQLAAAGGADAT
jgi:hypothetical protein